MGDGASRAASGVDGAACRPARGLDRARRGTQRAPVADWLRRELLHDHVDLRDPVPLPRAPGEDVRAAVALPARVRRRRRRRVRPPRFRSRDPGVAGAARCRAHRGRGRIGGGDSFRPCVGCLPRARHPRLRVHPPRPVLPNRFDVRRVDTDRRAEAVVRGVGRSLLLLRARVRRLDDAADRDAQPEPARSAAAGHGRFAAGAADPGHHGEHAAAHGLRDLGVPRGRRRRALRLDGALLDRDDLPGGRVAHDRRGAVRAADRRPLVCAGGGGRRTTSCRRSGCPSTRPDCGPRSCSACSRWSRWSPAWSRRRFRARRAVVCVPYAPRPRRRGPDGAPIPLRTASVASASSTGPAPTGCRRRPSGHRDRRPHRAVRRHPRRRSPQPRGADGPGHRADRAQRVGEEHDVRTRARVCSTRREAA